MVDAIARVDWTELFVPTHSLAEMVIRGTLMYLGLFLIFRFIVGRQSSSIGIADLTQLPRAGEGDTRRLRTPWATRPDGG